MAKMHMKSCEGCGRDTTAFDDLCAPCSMPGISAFSDQTGRHYAYEGQNGQGAYDGDTAMEFDDSFASDSRDDIHLRSHEPVAGEQFDPLLRAIALEEAETSLDEDLEWTSLETEPDEIPDISSLGSEYDPYDYDFDYEYEHEEPWSLNQAPDHSTDLEDVDLEDTLERPQGERKYSDGRRGHRRGDPGIGGNRHRVGRKVV